MENRVKPTLLNRIATPIVFMVGGGLALWWFFYRLMSLFLSGGDSVVTVEKGAYYLLGVGIGLLDLAFVIIWEQWLAKPLSKAVSKLFSKLALASLLLLIVTPHAIHYFANEHFIAKGYSECPDASRQWLFIRDIVYAENSISCSVELNNR